LSKKTEVEHIEVKDETSVLAFKTFKKIRELKEKKE